MTAYRSFEERAALRGEGGILQGNNFHAPRVDLSRTNSHPLICAHNINHLSPKLNEVRLFLSETCPFVFLGCETMRTSVKSAFLPGFNCVERFHDESVPGSRGLLVAVKRCARIIEIFSNHFALAVQVTCGEDVFIVVSIYACPRGHANRADSLRAILDAMAFTQDWAADAGWPILLGGDFNMSAEEHQRFIERYGAGAWRLLECDGNSTSFARGASRSSLDRFMVSGADVCFNKYNVCDVYDHSDHFPVFTRLNVDVSRCSSRRAPLKINRAMMTEKKAQVASHNYWAPLEALMDEDDASLDQVVNTFLETAEQVAINTEVVQRPRKQRARRHPLRRATIRAIHRRQELARAQPCDEAALEEARQEAKRMVRADQHADWVRFVARGAALRVGKPRLYWKWLRSVSGTNSKSVSLPFPSPVIDPSTATLVSTEASILSAWSTHYAELFKETNPQPAEHWEQVLHLEQGPELDTNAPLSWEEVCSALRATDGFKAAGPSGVQAAFLQAAADVADDEGVFPLVPTTPLGRVLYKIVVSLFTCAEIPESLACSLIISLHKKGPTNVTTNYRGIALMESLLKLVTSLVSRRLQAALDATNPLCREQAGFRSKEECAAQIAALYDVCERRRRDRRTTFVTFIDFKTAFDSVPHAALLYKLKARGVCGHTLSFITALYTNPCFQVMIAGGARGEKVAVERGVRQGCPLSPLLFNIYIDDILQGCKGVSVPGLDTRQRGLLFADDVALFAHDVASMKKTLRVVERWAGKHGMSFGVQKCGVMKIDGDVELLKLIGFSLQGQEIPVVETYTYLGYPFNSSLNLEKAAKTRAAKAQTKLNMLTRFLKNKAIPLGPKVDVLRTCMLPSLTYGGELFGMVKSVVAPLESVWGASVRMVMSGFSLSASRVLFAEFDLCSVYDVTCALRARAFVKFPNQLKTVMSDLCETQYSKSWYGKTKTWIRRFYGEDAFDEGNCTPAGLKFDLFTRDAYWVGKCAPAGAQRYINYAFAGSREYFQYFLKHPRSLSPYSLGMYCLVALRAGSFLTANRCAAAGLIAARYRNRCPCCEKGVKEDEYHLLVRCRRWDQEREASGLTEMIKEVARFNHRVHGSQLARDDLVALLLGGAVGDELLDEREVWGKSWYMAEGDQRPLFTTLTRFLASIRSQRVSAVWQHSTRCRSPVG